MSLEKAQRIIGRGNQFSEYNVLSKRQVHRRFGFDLLVARSESEEYRRYLEFFQQVRLEPGAQEGDIKNMATIKNEAQL